MHINDLLKIAVERKASDLHLKVSAFPILRIDGVLTPLTDVRRLMQEDTIAMAFSIMSARQKEKFKNDYEIDIAYSVPNLGRFRCNIFQQRGTVGLVLRVIPARILNIRELLLPPVLEKICAEQRGLVLCTGTTGSGKSTTLAAMIDHINAMRNEHIMTIEDPIEFLHRDKKSIINQREVEVDTKGFGVALRSALRQDPDVILVGEMRDYETIETALTAAETGHLVFSTLHTLDATETVNRIISVFPPHQQKQIRLQLGAVLKAVISLRLMPRADGLGRVPAAEILVRTAYVRECIENKEKTKLIKDAIQAGTSQYGMQTFDQSLYQLYKSGLITLEEALKRATNPNEFKLKIQGIQSTSDLAREEMDAELEAPTDFNPMEAEESPFDFSRQPPGLALTRRAEGGRRKTEDEASEEPSPARPTRGRLRDGPAPADRAFARSRGAAARARTARLRCRGGGGGARSAGDARDGSTICAPPGPWCVPGAERYGTARIERELAARGFSEETIERALSEVGAAAEEQVARADAFRRLWAASAGLAAEKRRRRIWNALVRRGFEAGSISAMMKGSGSTDDIEGSS